MRPLAPHHPESEPEPKRDARIMPDADLAWDAHRYLTDAMNLAEIATFEHRLGGEQVVREALAAAVDQIGAIQLVALESVKPPVSIAFSGSRRMRWMSTVGGMVAAALVLIGVGLAYRSTPTQPLDSGTDVATAWTDLRGNKSGSGDLAAVGTDSTVPSALGDDAEGAFVDFNAEEPVPSWMMAVVGPAPDSSEATPSEGQ